MLLMCCHKERVDLSVNVRVVKTMKFLSSSYGNELLTSCSIDSFRVNPTFIYGDFSYFYEVHQDAFQNTGQIDRITSLKEFCHDEYSLAHSVIDLPRELLSSSSRCRIFLSEPCNNMYYAVAVDMDKHGVANYNSRLAFLSSGPLEMLTLLKDENTSDTTLIIRREVNILPFSAQ